MKIGKNYFSGWPNACERTILVPAPQGERGETARETARSPKGTIRVGEGLYRYWVGAGREPMAFWSHGGGGWGWGRCGVVAVGRRRLGRRGAGCWRSRIGTDGENVGGLAAFIGPSSGGWRSVNARRTLILREFVRFGGVGGGGVSWSAYRLSWMLTTGAASPCPGL